MEPSSNQVERLCSFHLGASCVGDETVDPHFGCLQLGQQDQEEHLIQPLASRTDLEVERGVFAMVSPHSRHLMSRHWPSTPEPSVWATEHRVLANLLDQAVLSSGAAVVGAAWAMGSLTYAAQAWIGQHPPWAN